MKVFDRLGAIAAIFARTPAPKPAEAVEIRAAAADLSTRWVRARRVEPDLLGDLIRLGGVLTAQPFENGQVADLNRDRILYEQGRRDFALQLVALMSLTQTELNSLMENDDV